MALDINLTDEQTEKLAKAIARAQITAADDFIDEATANWLDADKAAVNRPGLTQSERFEAFRANRINAERALATDIADREKRAEQGRKNLEEHQSRMAARVEQNRLTNQSNLAQWKANCIAANRNGHAEPAQPALLPETPEDIARADKAVAYHSAF